MPSSDCKVYIGDLGSSASKHDLEDAFSPFGRLSNVWVARNPPGFAFVEFDDVRDAEDAVREMDGRSICGRRVRVEFSNGRNSRGGGGPGGRRGGGRPRGAHPEDKCYQCGMRGHFARDCRNGSGGGGGGGGGGARRDYRSRSSSPRRRRSYSRSASRDRSPHRSRSPRSRSPAARGRSRSRSYS